VSDNQDIPLELPAARLIVGRKAETWGYSCLLASIRNKISSAKSPHISTLYVPYSQ